MNAPKALLTAVAIALLIAGQTGSANGASITPVYQSFADDATWTHEGNGIYTVPQSAEDYPNEVWERPIQDNKWSEDGTTRTSGTTGGGGEYWAYCDLKKAAWGVGTSGGKDYLFARWELVGDFKHIAGENNPVTEELKGHYYFYAEPVGHDAFVIEVPAGKDLGSSYGSGKVYIYTESNDDSVPGSPNITITEEGGDSFKDGQVKGVGRTNTSTYVTEVAVKLSDLGLALSDFETAVDYAYSGVAVSNPSDPNTDLFANDHFRYAKGKGQEYDTVRFTGGPLIPEPATLSLLALGSLAMLRKRRTR